MSQSEDKLVEFVEVARKYVDTRIWCRAKICEILLTYRRRSYADVIMDLQIVNGVRPKYDTIIDVLTDMYMEGIIWSNRGVVALGKGPSRAFISREEMKDIIEKFANDGIPF